MRRSKGWEEKCRRCGRCCYEKIVFKGEIYYTPIPCEYLDPLTRLCIVYPRRHQARPGCAPLSEAHLRQGILPADCPYVEGIPGYKAPQLREKKGE